MGYVNDELFTNFIARSLVPILKPFDARSVVVMHNSYMHHVKQVSTLMQNSGAILQHLPPYSPDYHPLEETLLCE